MSDLNRRPLKTRQISFFTKLALFLVKIGLSPNQVSILSVVFAAIGAYGFYNLRPSGEFLGNTHWLAILLAIFGIQFRLLCNMIDGLMAVEGGKKSANGEIFNEVPDRFSDWFLILAPGYAIGTSDSILLAWVAVTLAILTAYVRAIGASMGKGQCFVGPMAKPHRMALLTLAAIVTGIELSLGSSERYALWVALWVIAIGSALTALRRLRIISN